MNYTLMPSLERRALIKTAITLWNQDDIRAITTNFSFKIRFISERREEWLQVEDKIIENVQELPLPESLKKKVLGIIKPIGYEILKYKTAYRNIDSRLVRESLNKLCWKLEGTVDSKKTAEAFIRDESLDIEKRYGLACTYCFKDDILMLWNKMPGISFNEKVEPIKHELVYFWTYHIKGEVTRIYDVIEQKWQACTPYQYAFEFAASDGNEVATEYFFQKLTCEEREESLVRSAKYACDSYQNQSILRFEDYPGVLCFLLSQMNEEQQAELFKYHPFSVLWCFLWWPWQSFFMETAKRIWAFLPKEYYDLLLSLIANKVKDGFKDYSYQELIREFWQQSPRTHKEYVIAEFTSGSTLKNLLQIKDKENIKLILKDATTSEREKIIFCDRGKVACEMLLYNDETDLLEFFVKECLSSKDMMIKFREEYKRKFSHSEKKRDNEICMCNKFFQFINNLIRKDSKRGLEEGNSGPSKRVCSFAID